MANLLHQAVWVEKLNYGMLRLVIFTRRSKGIIGLGLSVITIAFSPDNKVLASGFGDCTIRLWDIATGSHLKTLTGHSDDVSVIAFLPEEDYFASGSYDCTIRLWNVAHCLKISGFLGSFLKLKSCWKTETQGRVRNLKFLSDGPFLAADHFYSRLKNRSTKPRLLDLWMMNGWIYYGPSPVLCLPLDLQLIQFDVRGDVVVSDVKTVGF